MGRTCSSPAFARASASRLADQEAEVLGRLVQGGDARPAGAIDREDERPLRINRLMRRIARLRCEEAQDRPARQPD